MEHCKAWKNKIEQEGREREREGGNRGEESDGEGQRVTGCAVCCCYGKMFTM